MLLLIKEEKREREYSVSLQPVKLVALVFIDCCLKNKAKKTPALVACQ